MEIQGNKGGKSMKVRRKSWELADNTTKIRPSNRRGVIVIQEGSQIAKLLEILMIVGEFPMSSISLLGCYQTQMHLIKKATQLYDYYNKKTKEHYTTRLLTIVGKGRQKSLRMLAGAELILDWLGLLKDYKLLNENRKFSGDLEYRQRVHRVAEGYAMAYAAGLEINPMRMPKLQMEKIRNFFGDRQCFYGSKHLKEVETLAMSKNVYTRIIGAVFSKENVYAIYNTRGETMKWCGAGERKAYINLEEVSRMNAGLHRIKSAILFGKSSETALNILNKTTKTKRLEFCFDGIYFHIHFIPLDANGVRLLRLLCIEDWKEELLTALFPDEMRSYDKGGFEYDASIGRKFIFAFFDGNIARLQRFRFAAERTDGEYEVLCFPFQVEIVKGYLGDLAKIRTVKLEIIENALEIKNE